MTLIKTSLTNSIAVIVKVVCVFASNKIFAIYVGPGGYAFIGQFQNLLNLVSGIGNSILGVGVTKFTSETEGLTERIKIWRSATILALASSLIFGLVFILFSKSIAEIVFHESSYSNSILILGFSLSAIYINSLIIGVLNGLSDLKIITISSIITSITGLIISIYFVINYGILGGIISLIANQIIGLFILIYLCRNKSWLRMNNFFNKIDLESLKKFKHFALMGSISAICAPISQFLIRNNIVENQGWVSAGYWEAMNRLSGLAIMLVTAPLSVYYLPKISSTNNLEALKSEIIIGYRVILPFLTIALVVEYIARNIIIKIAFSDDFIEISNFFSWQLAGDFSRIGCWILSYFMLAKLLVKAYIFSEILSASILVVLSIFLSKFYKDDGVYIAYFINATLAWLLSSVIIYKFFNKKQLLADN